MSLSFSANILNANRNTSSGRKAPVVSISNVNLSNLVLTERSLSESNPNYSNFFILSVQNIHSFYY